MCGRWIDILAAAKKWERLIYGSGICRFLLPNVNCVPCQICRLHLARTSSSWRRSSLCFHYVCSECNFSGTQNKSQERKSSWRMLNGNGKASTETSLVAMLVFCLRLISLSFEFNVIWCFPRQTLILDFCSSLRSVPASKYEFITSHECALCYFVIVFSFPRHGILRMIMSFIFRSVGFKAQTHKKNSKEDVKDKDVPCFFSSSTNSSHIFDRQF